VSDSKTILLVDDDEDVRHALRLLFEFEGYEVVGEAGDGMEAVALARRYQPSFVILDYLMPKMSGDKTAAILRGISPESRIVAFSAVLQKKPEWADAYLNKERISEIAPMLAGLVEMGTGPNGDS
jgi:DNA-binding NarL/FixJ family response regulator